MERLEKLCVQADERAKRAEERQEALAKELRETRRDLEQVAAAAGTPVKKKVEDDEVVDVDELKRENEALKAKLAEAESKAAAAIDASITRNLTRSLLPHTSYDRGTPYLSWIASSKTSSLPGPASSRNASMLSSFSGLCTCA